MQCGNPGTSHVAEDCVDSKGGNMAPQCRLDAGISQVAGWTPACPGKPF